MAEQLVARGSSAEFLYAMEDSWAVLPGTPTVYKLRTTGFNVNLSKDTFTSNELRSDRQLAELRTGMKSIAGDINVELIYGAFDDLIESAMFNVWDSSNAISIGLTQRSFTLQRGFADIGTYNSFSGCVVNQWSVSIRPNAVVTSTFSVIGKDMGSTQVLTGGTDKSTYAPFDSFTGTIKEGGSTIGIVTGLDFTLNNNITPLQVLMQNTAVGLAEGRGNVTGTLTAYFADSTLLDKFVNETGTSIEVALTDSSGNTLTFYFPNVKYTGGDISVNDEGPVTISLPFTALKDDVYTTLYITK